MDMVTVDVKSSAGVEFERLNAYNITAARWEEPWDGLHYLRGGVEWHGLCSQMLLHTALNGIFRGCAGAT